MKTKGFTLIEMMLSVALLGILGGVSVPLYQSFQNQNQLSIATNTTAQTIRRAQILSRANDGDAQWGVYIQMGSVTLFQGDDFDDRDPAFDERTDIATTLSISGQQEYVFEKVSGVLMNAGSTNFSGPDGNEQKLSVNSEGVIDY